MYEEINAIQLVTKEKTILTKRFSFSFLLLFIHHIFRQAVLSLLVTKNLTPTAQIDLSLIVTNHFLESHIDI